MNKIYIQQPLTFDTFGSLQADLSPKKRQRGTTKQFVAKPSCKAKMNFEHQTAARDSKQRYDAKKKKDRLEQLQAKIKSLQRKDVANLLLPTVLEHVAMTKEGRAGITKAVAKRQNVSLPAGGRSKAAINKAKKTATDLTAGLATILHPENPKQLQSMMLLNDLPASIKTVAQMHPQNPHVATPRQSSQDAFKRLPFKCPMKLLSPWKALQTKCRPMTKSQERRPLSLSPPILPNTKKGKQPVSRPREQIGISWVGSQCPTSQKNSKQMPLRQ
jgi:hypothetical protein